MLLTHRTMAYMFSTLLIVVHMLATTSAQYGFHAGNFIGAGWSGGSWTADLAQIASTPPTGYWDAQAKQHDLDTMITGSQAIADQRAVQRGANTGPEEHFAWSVVAAVNNGSEW